MKEAVMTDTAFIGFGEQEHVDPVLEAVAREALSHWLGDHPEAGGELEEASRAHIHLQELEGRATEAARAAADAAQRAASLAVKLDPAGHRILGFASGALLVAALTVLDGVPLNWAAQAFGLNNAGTWLITGILLVASVGAMAGLEMTRADSRRRAGLVGVLVVAYVALLVLRMQFLVTVAGESLRAGALQAVLLTGLSASLVTLGSAVMARTRSLSLARARTAARRSRQAAAGCQAARRQAAEKMQRHLGAIRQLVLVRLSLGSAAPAGADHASWAAALERAVRALFPGQ
jgi:uncharacterized membrane protein